jgi:uncharacterized membrane protein (UPF0127 family)
VGTANKPALTLLALAALGAVVVLYGVYTAPAPGTSMQDTPTKTLTIDTTSTSSPQATVTIVAEVAATDAARALGLGGRTQLAPGTGMWFVFDEDGYWSFWMKDTLMSLDMLWVAADGTIVTIAHNVAPESYPQSYAPTAPARYVLEVPGGYAKAHGITEGDYVQQK